MHAALSTAGSVVLAYIFYRLITVNKPALTNHEMARKWAAIGCACAIGATFGKFLIYLQWREFIGFIFITPTFTLLCYLIGYAYGAANLDDPEQSKINIKEDALGSKTESIAKMSSVNGDEIEAKLAKLKELHSKNLIDDEDYKTKKMEVLRDL